MTRFRRRSRTLPGDVDGLGAAQVLLVAIALVACEPRASTPGSDAGATRETARPPSSSTVETGLGAAAAISRAEGLLGESRWDDAVRVASTVAGPVSADERCRLDGILARAYHRTERFESAVTTGERALACSGGTDPALLGLLGDSLFLLRRFDESRERFEALLRARPKDVRASVSLGRVLLELGEAEAAVERIEAALAGDLGVEARRARLDYGRALRSARRYEDACDQFVELLTADPFFGAAYSELAKTYYRRRLRGEGKFVESIYQNISKYAFEEFVEEQLTRTGMTAFALGQSAANLTRQRRFAAAFANYERAMAVDARDPRFRIYYAELCGRFGRTLTGIRALDAALAAGSQPRSGLLFAKAILLFDVERSVEAHAAARAGVDALRAEGDLGGRDKGQAPELPLQFAAVRGAVETGQPELARSSLEAVRNSAPEAWEIPYWEGRIRLVERDHEAALERFRAAEASGGERYPDVRLWGARALIAAKKTAEAVRILEGLLASHPEHRDAYELLLESAPPDRAGELRSRYGSAVGARDRADALRASIGEKPLVELGSTYKELGSLYVTLRDPRAFDCLFLASDLLPDHADVIRGLLGGMTAPQDVFLRLHFLERYLALEPDLPAALADAAGIYVKMKVRSGRALELAQRLHRREVSPVSFRLLGEATKLAGDTVVGIRILEAGLDRFPGDERLSAALAAARSGGGE